MMSGGMQRFFLRKLHVGHGAFDEKVHGFDNFPVEGWVGQFDCHVQNGNGYPLLADFAKHQAPKL